MHAALLSIVGNVSDVRSHWTADGSRIVTEATVETDHGPIVVSQLGGTVDGLAMRTMPGPPVLELGMYVAVEVHGDLDLAQLPYDVGDDAEVDSDSGGF